MKFNKCQQYTLYSYIIHMRVGHGIQAAFQYQVVQGAPHGTTLGST